MIFFLWVQNGIRLTMAEHLEKLKEILIADLGENVVAQLTDNNIQQFAEVLDICAEILAKQGKKDFM